MKNQLFERITRSFAPLTRIILAAIFALAAICATTGAAWADTTTSITAPSSWGGTKPAAVWCGDFPATGNDSPRNGYTLNLNGNATTDGIVTIGGSSSTGGVTVKTTTGKTAVGVVAGIKGVASSSAIRILMSSYQTDSNDNRTMVGFKANESKFSGFTSGPTFFNSNNISWTSNANTNYFAFYYQGTSGTGRGTYAYLNGSDTIYNNAGTLAYGDSSVLGVTFGGAHGTKDYNMDGAVISYAAVLDATSATDLSSVLKYWSLTDISSIEVHKTAGNIEGGTGRGITLDLSGGTVTVSGVKTAAAVFVQSNTTLDFSADSTSRLAISGPLYIATGATLTIKLGTLSNGYRRPITMGSCFASNNQIAVEYATPAGSTTSILPKADSITAFTQDDTPAAVSISDYTPWNYGTDVFTWISTSTATTGDVDLWKYIKFDVATGQSAEGATAIAGGNATTYDGVNKFWHYWCYSKGAPAYKEPGMVARFLPDDSDNTYRKTVPAGFSPLTLGGLIVESGAAGYSFENDSGTRGTTLGDPKGETETRFTILEDFAINRNGAMNLVGTTYFDIAAGKVLSLNASRADNQQPVVFGIVGEAESNGYIESGSTSGGCLKMHGEGLLEAKKLTASGACLDYSALATSRTVPYIDAQLVVDSSTSYKFPALSGVTSYQLATKVAVDGSITGEQTFEIGGHEYKAPLTFDNVSGTVVFPYVATENGSGNVDNEVDWSAITWDARPVAAPSSSDVVTLNIAGNTTLDFDQSLSVDKLVLNIAEGAELTLKTLSNLTTANGIVLRGTGALKIDSATTISYPITVDDNVSILFSGDTAKLTVSGTLTVNDGKTLYLAPGATSAACTEILSYTSASGNIELTAPTESGYVYNIVKSATKIYLMRAPFSYDGTIGATPTGWITDFDQGYSEKFTTAVRVGPDSSMPVVHGVVDGQHPWKDIDARTGKMTFALYADVSQVSSAGGKCVLVSFGRTDTANNKILALYREGINVKLAVWDVGTAGTTETAIVGTAASVAAPGAGFHLYTATFDNTNGNLELYLDDAASAQTGSAGGAVTLSKAFQLGSICGGLDASTLSGEHGLAKGIGMSFAAIRGYDGVLASSDVAVLATQFPATALPRTGADIQLNESGKTLTVYASDVDSATTFGPEEGDVVIAANNTVTVSKFRTYPGNGSSGGNNTVTVNGKLIVSQTDSSSTLTEDGDQNKGVVLGFWLDATSGTRETSVAVPTDGEFDASNSYILMPWSGNVQSALLEISGGTVKTKGLLSKQSGKGKVKLHLGGILEVAEILSNGEAIEKEFWKGTLRVTADATETRAVKFKATSAENATILDPNGHTLTLNAAAVTGDGYIKAKSSAAGETKGTVSIGGSAGDFTGTIVIDDDGKDLITISDLAAYHGKILYKVTGTSDLPAYLSGYTGTLTISGGTVDARSIDLSNAQVILADGATLKATVGQEGPVTVATGTTLSLYATDDVYNYEGHVFSGSSSGTVNYYYGETPTAAAAASINGNNLLPYYQIWEVSGGTGSGAVNATANWKGGAVPGTQDGRTTDGNAAFHVTGGSEITVTVDQSFDFNELQVFGSGTIIFAQSGENKITASVMAVSSGVNVKLSGAPIEIFNGIIYGGAAQTITVQNEASLSLDNVNCTVKIVIEDGGSLTTSGDTTLSAENRFEAGSSFEVAEEVGGITRLNAEETGLRGDITIGAGATLVNTKSSDALQYDATENEKLEVKVYGILDMGSTRWTLGEYNKFTLHEGAIIRGTGDGNGALDTKESSNTAFAIDGDATISAMLRIRGGMTFDVANGKTLTLSGGTRGDGNDTGTLTKTGTGILDVTTATSYTGTTTVSEGQMNQSSFPLGNVVITEGATFTLRNVAWTEAPGRFSGGGTLEFINDRKYVSSVDHCQHTVTGVTFPGTIKFSATNSETYGLGHVIVNDGFLSSEARPQFEVNTFNDKIYSKLFFGNNWDGKTIAIRDLKGSGDVCAKAATGTANTVTIESKQTDNSVFTGNIICNDDEGQAAHTIHLAVIGDGSGSVHSLTLGEENSSIGELSVADGAKVIFSDSGTWLEGATKVKAGGVLESQRDVQVVGALTLESGAKLSIANGHVLKTGAVTLPESGVVYIDASALTALTSEGATVIESTSAFEDSDIEKFRSVGHHEIKLDSSDKTKIKVYPSVAKVGDKYYASLSEAETAVGDDTPAITIYSGSPTDSTIYHDLGESDGAHTYRLKDQNVYLVSGTWSSSAVFWMADNTPTPVFSGDTVVIDGTHYAGNVLAVDPTGPANATSVSIEKDITLTQIADGTILAGTTFTIADGVTLTVSGVSGTVTLGAATFNKASTTGAVTLDGSTNGITLGGNISGSAPVTIAGTVTATGMTIANTLKNTTGGTIVYDGTLLGTAPTFDSSWTGTVWLKNYTDLTGSVKKGTAVSGTTNFDPNAYGNSNSTVKFTGVKGYFQASTDGSYTIQPALELEDNGETPGLLLYNGWGYNKEDNSACYTIIRDLKGSGTLKADMTADGSNGSIKGYNVLLQVSNWNNFSGTLNMSNKNVVFGSTLPEQTAVEGGGKIFVRSGASVTIPSAKTWTCGTFYVDGTLSATDKERWSGAISIGSEGKLKMTSTANFDESNDDKYDYSGVTGTGTIEFNGTGWRGFPNVSPADTLSIVPAQSDGLVFRVAKTIGSLSGSGNLRTDLSDNKDVTVKQAKDGVWSGCWAGAYDRLNTFKVCGGATSAGTLTLAGQPTHTNGLIVCSADASALAGSVNLTGSWVGAATVEEGGTFGGVGTVSSVTFNNGSIFKVFEPSGYGTGTSYLKAPGGVTVADVAVVWVETSQAPYDGMVLMDWTEAEGEAVNAAPAGKFRFANETYRRGYGIGVSGKQLVVSAKTGVTMDVAADTTTEYGSDYDYCDITKTSAGTAKLTGALEGVNLTISAGTVELAGATMTGTLSGAGILKISANTDLSGVTLSSFTGSIVIAGGAEATVTEEIKNKILATASKSTVVDNGDGAWTVSNTMSSTVIGFASNDTGVTVNVPAHGSGVDYLIFDGELTGVEVKTAPVTLTTPTAMSRIVPYTISADVTLPNPLPSTQQNIISWVVGGENRVGVALDASGHLVGTWNDASWSQESERNTADNTAVTLVAGGTYHIVIRYWGVVHETDKNTPRKSCGYTALGDAGTSVWVDGTLVVKSAGLKTGSSFISGNTESQFSSYYPSKIAFGGTAKDNPDGLFAGLVVNAAGFVNGNATFGNVIADSGDHDTITTSSPCDGPIGGSMTVEDGTATYKYDYGVTAVGTTGGYQLTEQANIIHTGKSGSNWVNDKDYYTQGVTMSHNQSSAGSVTVTMKVNIPSGSTGGTICEIPLSGDSAVTVTYDGATDKFALNGTAQTVALSSADGEHTLKIVYDSGAGAYLWVDNLADSSCAVANATVSGKSIGDKIYFGSGAAATSSNGFFANLGVESQNVAFAEASSVSEAVLEEAVDGVTFASELASIPLVERVKYMANVAPGATSVPVPTITIGTGAGAKVLSGYAALSAARTLGAYTDTQTTLGVSSFDSSSCSFGCAIDNAYAGQLFVSLVGSTNNLTWKHVAAANIPSASDSVTLSASGQMYGSGNDYRWLKIIEQPYIYGDNTLPAAGTLVHEMLAKTPVEDKIFKYGQITGNQSQCYRIPAIASTWGVADDPANAATAKVMGIFDARYCYQDLGVPVNSDGTTGNAANYANPDHYTGIDIAGCFSLDGGDNWSYPHVMIDVPNSSDPQTGVKTKPLTKLMELGDPCIVYDAVNQKFIMMGITGGGLTTVSNDRSDVVTYECSLSSVQNGNPDWTSRTSVKSQIEEALVSAIGGGYTIPDPITIYWGSGYQGILQCPGSALVLRKAWNGLDAGTIVWPMQYCYVDGTGKGGLFVAWKSGEDWHATKPIPNDGETTGGVVNNYLTQEGALEQLDDGNLYFMAKDAKNTNGSIDRPFYKYDATSGEWVYATKIDKSIRVQGSMIRIGEADGVSRYAAVFCTGDDTSPETFVRKNLRLFVGTDSSMSETPGEAAKGVIWNETPYADIWLGETGSGSSRCFGYSSLVMLNPTTLGVLFEADGHIYFTKVDVAGALQ